MANLVGYYTVYSHNTSTHHMLAMECSNPIAVNVKVGHQTAKILLIVSSRLQLQACHQPRQTSQLALFKWWESK